MKVTLQLTLERVIKAVEGATYRNLSHAIASIRKSIIANISSSPHPSAPGTPPNTRRGQLRRAIVYDVQGDSAIAGPRHSFVGESGAGQEFGGKYKDRNLPARPYMGPGLEEGAPRFAQDWEGSIGE